MEHHVAQDLLVGYAEGTLTPETKTSLEEHLAGCAECRGILEEDLPISLPLAPTPPIWTQKRAVRTGRRALFRAALAAVFAYLLVGVPLTALSRNAISAVIDRNGRGVVAAQVPASIGTLFVPGGQARTIGPESKLMEREYGARISRQIGGIQRNVGDIWLKIGLSSTETRVVPANSDATFPANPYSSTWNPTGLGTSGGSGLTQGILPDGSVITVQLFFDGLSLEEARDRLAQLGCGRVPTDGGSSARKHAVPVPKTSAAIAPAPAQPVEELSPEARFYSNLAETSVTWVGFAADPSGLVGGYSAVGGFGHGYLGAPSGCDLEVARKEVTAKLDLLSRPEFSRMFEGGDDGPQALRTARKEISENPRVVTIVVTGPTRSVEKIIQGAKAVTVFQLDQDLYNY